MGYNMSMNGYIYAPNGFGDIVGSDGNRTILNGCMAVKNYLMQGQVDRFEETISEYKYCVYNHVPAPLITDVNFEFGNSEEEIAAAWECVKFLMSDEQVAANHIETGVLPTTYSAVEGNTLQEFWADDANEGYKISYEQVEYSSAPAMSLYTSEWNSIVGDVYSELIQARDITPEQAVENLQKEWLV